MLVSIVRTLKNKRQISTGFKVEPRGTRCEVEPEQYTSIDMHYIIKSKSISKETVEETISLTEERYCSVRGTLGITVKITSS